MNSGWSAAVVIMLSVLVLVGKARFVHKVFFYDSYRVSVAVEGGIVVVACFLVAATIVGTSDDLAGVGVGSVPVS